MTPKQERDREAEANYFAICLLMPEEMVHAELDALMNRHGLKNEQTIMRKMATTFGVSEVMMTMRLVQLGRMMPP